MIEKDQPPLEGDLQGALRTAQPQALDEADPSLLVRPEVRPGAFPGNEYIRFVYPRRPTLRRACWRRQPLPRPLTACGAASNAW